MNKYEITITEEEIMQSINKKRSTYFAWKSRCPKEYDLIKEALLKRKLEEKIRAKVSR